MPLPSADTPLYNHPLPDIEQWLRSLGCQQNRDDLHCWLIQQPNWKAEICLEIEELTVQYLNIDQPEKNVTRSFKYSLSRQDVEAAVFSGP